MPELPDVTVYVERIAARFVGRELRALAVSSPFLLRTHSPSVAELAGLRLVEVRRIGKRIAMAFAAGSGEGGELVAVVHLMVAGRFRLQPAKAAPSGNAALSHRAEPAHKAGPSGKAVLAAFTFAGRREGEAEAEAEAESLVLTEFSKKKRASLHLVRGWEAAEALSRGGIEPLDCSLEEFGRALRLENRTLKRALTDPRIFSGIGNAYSDEMLFWACLSPVARTHSLDDEAVERLYVACRQTLLEWTTLLRKEAGDGFPGKVTAFREEMAVHGRFKQPCRVCGTAIQRIAYAENEVNYCARCQTGGRLLADRALSRLLHADWPRRIEDLEELQAARNPAKVPSP
ncbi:MAG TPA: DNA-formamidopyrimidine glycosylase family protein [Polyangiaceae bacterium]|nr:DNA-formamidopyrimidine glycosylase family protein [Polyangiaceae bacterium]